MHLKTEGFTDSDLTHLDSRGLVLVLPLVKEDYKPPWTVQGKSPSKVGWEKRDREI